MLDLSEKIGFGFGGLCVVLTLGIYYFVGLPSTNSVEFLPKVRKLPDSPKTAAPSASAASPPAVSEEEQAIVQKLQEQGVKLLPGQRLQEELDQVPPDLFEHASAEANWTRELKKAHSDRIHTKAGDTRLKVYNIAEDSLLKHFGIQDNDVIELIDGEIIAFNETSTRELYGRAKTLFNKLREGGTISVTVTRSNRPVHIKFRL
jgi:hypothetical protein